jgi:4-hydroxybenzoate polyprenyltransferase
MSDDLTHARGHNLGEVAVPLAVDLDGTLALSDATWESALQLARQRPGMIPAMVAWAARGAAHFKECVAARVALDPAVMPYHAEVLAAVRAERAAGREVCLATASHRRHADVVAAHLGCFDRVIASEGGDRCAAESKRARLIAQYGDKGFDYAGNSRQDVAVWAGARRGWVVSRSRELLGRARAACEVERVFDPGTGGWGNAWRALRPLQWAKNLLLFAPLITSKRLADAQSVLPVAWGAVLFCLAASACYLANDVLDLQADRHHPRKRERPVARGLFHPSEVLTAAVILGMTAWAGTILLGTGFAALLGGYMALTLLYSLALKRLVLGDVLGLAVLYLVRLEAGCVAGGVGLSRWLAVFAFLLFLSLALAKRHGELMDLVKRGGREVLGRGYGIGHLSLVRWVGQAAALAACAVIILYGASASARVVYATPPFLWGVAGVFLVWVGRLWWLARRGLLHEDPLVFTSRDAFSYVMAALTVGFLLLGIYVRRGA